MLRCSLCLAKGALKLNDNWGSLVSQLPRLKILLKSHDNCSPNMSESWGLGLPESFDKTKSVLDAGGTGMGRGLVFRVFGVSGLSMSIV